MSKIFIRVSNSLKATKKPIGIRMGKGKGAIDNYYLPVNKGQIFIEFYFKDYMLEQLNMEKRILRSLNKVSVVFSKRVKIKVRFLKIF